MRFSFQNLQWLGVMLAPVNKVLAKCTLLMVLIVLTYVVLFQQFIPALRFHKNIRSVCYLMYKKDFVKQIKPPRLFVIGASGITLGIDYNTLAKTLPQYYPVNLQIWRGYGVMAFLEQFDYYFQSGDLVLLQLEPFLLSQEPYEPLIFLEQWAHYPVSMIQHSFKSIDALHTEGLSLLKAFQWVLLESIPPMISPINTDPMLSQAIRLDLEDMEECVHRYRAITDQYGAYNYHFITMPDASRRCVGGLNVRQPSQILINYLQDWMARMKQRGVDVVMTYPAISQFCYQKYHRWVYHQLQSRFDPSNRHRFISNIEAEIYPNQCFTDAVFHLYPSCRVQRSVKLSRMLKDWVQQHARQPAHK